MAKLALITGASSGLGREFARIHAERGGDCIIAARSEDKLRELKAELESAHGVKVHVFKADLATENGPQKLYDEVKAAKLAPDFLINNAGFGGQGAFLERDLAKDIAMVDLNVRALMTLTHLLGKDMVARGSGKILNVGSSAGFAPGPYQATYFASKAFVNSFSQAVAEELRDTGVTCSVLTPGYVETGFVDNADLGDTGLTEQTAMTARDTAQIGYYAMLDGTLLKADRLQMTILGKVASLLPRRTVLRQTAELQRK